MKYIITEDQLEKVKDKILKVPFVIFDNDWEALQMFLRKRGNPPYIITDDVDLSKAKLKSLGSLIMVQGDLTLPAYFEFNTFTNLIKVDGNLQLSYSVIKSLGSLRSVGGYLNLSYTSVESLGELMYVGERLNLKWCTELKSLDNLVHVGSDLWIQHSSVTSFGKLKHVGRNLDMVDTEFVKGLNAQQLYELEKEIRSKIHIEDDIFDR
jgi:hypothetical protein